MKEIIVTDLETKKEIIDYFFKYLNPGKFVLGLRQLSDERSVGWGSSPYTHIFVSCAFSRDEKGYFGENKVRFEDETYTDDIIRIVEMSNSEFFDVLTEYSNQYGEQHPEEKSEVEELLPKIKKRLNLD